MRYLSLSGFPLPLCLPNLSPPSFFFPYISRPSCCLLLPLPILHRALRSSAVFFLFIFYFFILPLLVRLPALAAAAEVPLSQCAAGLAMKMCTVWHSWNESPNRRGSGYHRAPPGPATVCLTLIMAHANECEALKSGESCLPDSVCGGVASQCVRVELFCACVIVCVRARAVLYSVRM